MRILLTSILCHSGLMTHVWDLVRFIQSKGLFVAVAYQKNDFLSMEEKHKLLTFLGEHNYCMYETVQELAYFAVENKIDLIHAHSHATFNMATAVCKVFKIPLVVTLHSIYPWTFFYGKALQTAKKIIAVGPGQANSALAYKDKIEIISNGIDITQFRPEKQHFVDESQVINVLWYGRVDGRLSQGIAFLDELAPRLPEHIKISALGSTDHKIQNMPNQKWTANPVPYLQKSHIVFAHGRSLREAMACGSIGFLIGYGYGGMITEKLLEGLDFVVDAFPQYNLEQPNINRVLQKIIQLSSDKRHLSILRKNARYLAEKYFASDLMGDKILAVYRETITSFR